MFFSSPQKIKLFLSEAEIEWQENNMCVVTANGKKITLGKLKDKLIAFAYKCPHAGGIMADGFFDAMGNVVCPLHRYRFSTKTGRNSTGEEYLKIYKIDMNEDGVFVEI